MFSVKPRISGIRNKRVCISRPAEISHWRTSRLERMIVLRAISLWTTRLSRNPYSLCDQVYLRPPSGRCDAPWTGPHRVMSIRSAVAGPFSTYDTEYGWCHAPQLDVCLDRYPLPRIALRRQATETRTAGMFEHWGEYSTYETTADTEILKCLCDFLTFSFVFFPCFFPESRYHSTRSLYEGCYDLDITCNSVKHSFLTFLPSPHAWFIIVLIYDV